MKYIRFPITEKVLEVTKPVPKTLDVERATRWLVENHPRQECRNLAEILHDYSLSVTEIK